MVWRAEHMGVWTHETGDRDVAVNRRTRSKSDVRQLDAVLIGDQGSEGAPTSGCGASEVDNSIPLIDLVHGHHTRPAADVWGTNGARPAGRGAGPVRTPRTAARIRKGIERTGATGLEPATSGVTGRRSNQLNYAPERRRIVAAA